LPVLLKNGNDTIFIVFGVEAVMCRL